MIRLSYEYIKLASDDALFTAGYFTVPVPCSKIFYEKAFLMPLKHQAKDLFTFNISEDRRHFDLYYNNAKKNVSTKEAEEIRDKMLYHMDYIHDHLVDGNAYPKTPFAHSTTPFKGIVNNVIILNGRLPMQEDYFLRYYWEPLRYYYQCKTSKKRGGYCYRIHIGKDQDGDQTLSVSITYPRYEAGHSIKANESVNMSHVNALILNDLSDLVEQAIRHYEYSCTHNDIPLPEIRPTL